MGFFGTAFVARFFATMQDTWSCQAFTWLPCPMASSMFLPIGSHFKVKGDLAKLPLVSSIHETSLFVIYIYIRSRKTNCTKNFATIPKEHVYGLQGAIPQLDRLRRTSGQLQHYQCSADDGTEANEGRKKDKTKLWQVGLAEIHCV